MEDYKKKYEEALERAKDLHDNHALGMPFIYQTCEQIFPELKESEDEGIRKALIDFFLKQFDYASEEGTKKQLRSWIAWLEKQREQKFPSLSEKEIVCLKRTLDFLREEHNSYTGKDFTNEIAVLEWLITHPVLIHPSELQQNQGEQNPTWSEEDEAMLLFVGIILNNHKGDPDFTIYNTSFEASIIWLKSLKERYSWKPSDERNPKMIQWKGDNLREVVDFTGKSPMFDKWFKSWEEFEAYVHSHNDIFKLFDENGNHYEIPVGAWIVKTPDGYNVASRATYIEKLSKKQGCFIVDKKTIDEVIKRFEYLNYWVCGGNDDIINKLKHLKHNICWKPSKEQMKALWDSIPENVKEISEREMLLDSLYQDLKKLREE